MDSINSKGSIRSNGYDRKTYLTILDTALQARSWRFARQAALLWLAVYPGDLEIRLRLAKAQAGEGRAGAAISLMEEICRMDPEFVLAQSSLADEYLKNSQPEKAAETWALVSALGSGIPEPKIPQWAMELTNAYKYFAAGELEKAENSVHTALGARADFLLAAVLHLRLTRSSGNIRTVNHLAGIYKERWPETLIFTLALAEAQMELGDEARAVALLHQCVSRDSAGQVANRYWGKDHRYRSLWPERLEGKFDLVIPAEVSGPLGLNRLPEGKNIPEGALINGNMGLETGQFKTDAPTDYAGLTEEEGTQIIEAKAARIRRGMQGDEAAREAAESFSKLAKKIKKPALGKVDGRFPVYVIFSTRKGMEAQYGPQTSAALEQELRKLAGALNKRPGWAALVHFPDDLLMTSKLGIKPVDGIDPWKLKLALVDLDHALGSKGQRIGAVLIIGGSDVVPFHKLPNPTDDTDSEVNSDNPYGTLDSNYFVPEWPVGRLPGEVGPDAGLLIEQIRKTAAYHNSQNYRPARWWTRPWLWLRQIQPKHHKSKPRQPFGYTAAAWQRSSQEVFHLNGMKHTLVACPPEGTETVNPEDISSSTLAYFNLHGLEDGSEWYGQRDPGDRTPGIDYPVALSPHNLVKNGAAPKVVFSEACYGGLVNQKRETEAISLRFLSIGSQVVVGSTCVAYGSVAAPLIGADFLGSAFWKHLQNGLSAGDALMQAKIDLVKEMSRRQGFLDGEDQKTLLSFVLYGDPLVSLQGFQKGAKTLPRFRSHPKVTTVSDRPHGDLMEADLSSETMDVVKRVLEPYLPGFSSDDISVTHQQFVNPTQGSSLPVNGSKNNQNQGKDRTVVTVSKQVQIGVRKHHRFARLTFNARGKVVKMALSR